MVLNICSEEYTIKFSTRLYAEGNILDEVSALSKSDDDGIANLKPFLNCVTELLLAGLQKDKEHTQYHYDLDDESDKKQKRILVFDLLDDFVDNGGDVFDLFSQLSTELQERGFLGNLKKQEEVAKKKTVAKK